MQGTGDILAKLLEDKFSIRDIFYVQIVHILHFSLEHANPVFVCEILDKNRQYFGLENII